MALVYKLVNKPQVFGKITKWFLLILEYDFKIMYKHGRSHLMVDALSRFPNQVELVHVHDETISTCSHYSQNGYKMSMTIY
jgi:hypothetical protein